MTSFLKTNGLVTPNNMSAADMVRALNDAPVRNIADLKGWWRPDYRLTGTGTGAEASGGSISWTDMVSKIALTAMSDTGPLYVASAHNSKPCLRFNPTGRNGRMHDAGAHGLWRASASVTLAYVAKDSGGANTAYIGTSKASGFAQVQHASSGAVRVQHAGVNLFTGSVPGDTNPHFGIYSYDFSDHSYAFRINGASVATGTAAAEVDVGNLTVGTAGAAGSPTFRGDFYELLVFWAPLHVAGRADDLEALETYLANRYAL